MLCGKIKKLFIIILLISLSLTGINLLSYRYLQVCAYSNMPLYNLRSGELETRSSFYTTYASSSEERKFNIALASKAINGYFLEAGAEFSFNEVVGERTEKRGYKQAKIILNGEFVDGIGGGVCQVSTTLYNAVLLAGLKVTECHPHSLSVNYVALSFDAMVNYGGADLRFVNTTRSPIIIYTTCSSDRLMVKIIGETLKEKYVRESILKKEILPQEDEILVDEKGEYPELFEGERKVISYGKKGYVSEGYIIKQINGKTVERIKIRSDKYASRRGVVVEGTAERVIDNENFLYQWFLNKFLPI